jgi:PAS domain S-box-containing protein
MLIFAVMVVFASALTMYMTERLEKRTEHELTQQVVLLGNTMSSYHAALADSAVKLAAVFDACFPQSFSINPAKSVLIEGKQTPLVSNGKTVINLNNSAVDRFTAMTMAVGTVFVRSGDDFIRVTTSLKKEDGSRAIGTLLEKNHPAYEGLLKGLPYVGKAELFGKDYMTSYKPVKDKNGAVIAVLFIGLDFTDNLKSLKDKIRSTKIGKSGYIYMLDAKDGHDYGKLQLHPAKEGTNIADSRDSDGRAFIEEILKKKDGTIRYPWVNQELGEVAPREKLVAYRYFPEWNWIICAGSWLDELNGEARALLNALMGATALVAVILVLLFRNMIRMESGLTSALQNQVNEYQKTQDELHATEEQLRIQLYAAAESAQKFAAVFENSPITIALTTLPEGAVYAVNQAFTNVFGYEQDEALGKTTVELGLWLQDEDRVAYLQQLSKYGSVHNYDIRMRRKDGEIIDLLFYATMLEIAGKPLVLCAVMDMTGQKQLQEQLHHAQKMDVVGQLAGGIAHDFNNMLAAIIGSSEVLKLCISADPKKHKMVDTIIEAATRSADLTRDLLTFSRKQKGGSAPVDMHDTISSVIALLERTIDRGIEIRKSLTAPNSTVSGDQTQLQNALLNLGINARDAMSKGGMISFATAVIQLDGAVCFSSSLNLNPGRYLKITVSDTGTGMPKEILERIFEPFFTTKEVGKGTGLGLAAVYGTLASHGGGISVQSQPGNGTEFTLYLPLIDAGTKEPALYEECGSGSGGILLVDDEDALRTVGGELLANLGYRVFLAENGDQALEQFAANRNDISLVILDVIMPSMGGKETFQRLRQLDPDVKVLFCSGFHCDGTAKELVELGACGFIQKPYTLQQMSRIVVSILG